MYISISRPTERIEAVFSQFYQNSNNNHEGDKNDKKDNVIMSFDALFAGIFDHTTSVL